MPLGIRPYPCSHKLALPLHTYLQPKARDLPATRPFAKTSDSRDVPHKAVKRTPDASLAIYRPDGAI